MEKTAHKKRLDFTQGRPKICVPITGESFADVTAAIKQAQETPADMLEWRTDHFQGDLMPALAQIAQQTTLPLLCTLRTREEGGNALVTGAEYQQIVSGLITSGFCDYVDIELSAGEAVVKKLIELAGENRIATVVSKHDFVRTPPLKTLLSTFRKMHGLGADLPKIAVMPCVPEDVLVLLEASLQASREIGPLAAISMGDLGKISRVAGGIFGSRLTFSSGTKRSAPGQIPAQTLSAMMQTFLTEQ